MGVVLDGLRAAGDEVVEANAPLGLTTAERVDLLRRPWRIGSLAWRLLGRWLVVARKGRAARRSGPLDAVIVGYLGHFDVILARLLFPRTRVVLDMLIFAADTARDRGTSNRLTLGVLSLLDRLAAACADVIMVDTAEHAALLRPADAPKVLVIDVGAPLGWFRPGGFRPGGERPPRQGPLRVVFFGLYTPLQGAPVIGGALAALSDRADVEVTMIGGGQDAEDTRRRALPNAHVTWLDWVPSSELPALVATFDVCLGIFGTTPKALRVVPNKVFQGAAAGCAIVTSDTPPQRRALGDDALLVPPGDAMALAGALAALADDRMRTEALGVRAQHRAAAHFTPAAVAAPLRRRLA